MNDVFFHFVKAGFKYIVNLSRFVESKIDFKKIFYLFENATRYYFLQLLEEKEKELSNEMDAFQEEIETSLPVAKPRGPWAAYASKYTCK